MPIGQRTKRGVSLHIGVNHIDKEHYGVKGRLKACENDARVMANIALEQGFSAKMLLTENATRHNVTTAISEAAEILEAGDIFFISFAGHGTQLPDTNNDEGLEGKDETWCLYDGMIIDDELKTLWASFKKDVRITLICDSCHSGTASRGDLFAEPKARMIAHNRALKVYNRNKGFYNDILDNLPNEADLDIKCEILLISAVQDHQKALDGRRNGSFTSALKQVWNRGKFDRDYVNFYETLTALLPDERMPNYMIYPQANPDFEGQIPFSI